MPLGVRDVLLVIRAKDQASRQIREVGLTLGALEGSGVSLGQKLTTVGTSMIALGTGLAAVGIGGLAFIHSSVSAFEEFDAASRKTLTQVSGFVPSLKEVEQVALDVGRNIAVPFNQLQPALFDIFSSIPVKNMQDAKDVLVEMSKAAVAGATDVQTVARSNFEIMNAFGLKTSDLNHLLDVQFNLVKLGIGDYASINDGIGRLAPTAQIAGQSIETMAGSLAFATRIMGPGGTAISAVSRAFEGLANPKVVERLKAMGIAAVDATGNFRPFGDVLGELAAKLQQLPNAEKVKVLNDLFKGAGGTIQARRFLTEAVTQYGNLKDAIDAMTNSAGSLDGAYAIMAAAPVNTIQLLSNGFQELKISIGEAAAPVLLQFVTVLQNVLDWFNNLSDGTKEMIGRFILVASIVSVVMGVIIALGGALLLLIGVLMTMGVTLGGAITLLLGVPAAIVLVIGALTELILHWQQVKDKIREVIDRAREWFDNLPTWEQALVVFAAAIMGTVTALVLLSTAFTTLQSVMGAIKIAETLASIASAIAGFAESAGLIAVLADPLTWLVVAVVAVIAVITFLIIKFGVWGDIVNFFQGLWQGFIDLLSTSWQIIQQVAGVIVDFFEGKVIPAVTAFGSVMADVFNTTNSIIAAVVGTIVGWLQFLWDKFSGFVMFLSDQFGTGIMDILHAIGGLFSTVFSDVATTIVSLWSRLMWFWSGFTTIFIPIFWFFKEVVTNVFNWIAGIAKDTLGDTLVAVFGLIVDTLGTLFDIWQQTWSTIGEIVGIAMGLIEDVINIAFGILQSAWDNFGYTIFDIVKNIWDLISGVIATAITLIKDVIDVGLKLIQGDWGGAWDAIKQFFIDAWQGIWNALQAVWAILRDFFVSLPGNILGFIGDVARLLWQKGIDILYGLWAGLVSMKDWFVGALGGIAQWIKDVFIDAGVWLWQAAIDLVVGLWHGIESMKDWIVDKVKSFAGSIVDGFKSAVGIGSPSKVMAEMGVFMGLGLANGIIDSYGTVSDAMAGMVDTATGTLNANIGVSGSLNGGGTGLGVNVTVPPVNTRTVSVTFADGAIQVSGADDPQAVAKEIMAQFEEMIAEATQQGVGG